MGRLICQIKGHIQPFERTLAMQEMRALTNGSIVPLDGDFETAKSFSIASDSNIETLKSSLAFWHSVGDDNDALTDQLRSEATQIIARNRNGATISHHTVSDMVPFHLPNRRHLRYATHGIHEYRGKFFPQLVRALMNIAQLGQDARILDPMCGSGTTLVEARLSGRNSIGIDMNPLSVFMSDVKCRSLALDSSSLTNAFNTLEKAVLAPLSERSGSRRSASLAQQDRNYLERWFSDLAVIELDHIADTIDRLAVKATLKDFYRLVLSNILRKVSWQKDEDLRVRREEKDFVQGEAIRLFLDEAERTSKTVATFLAERRPEQLGRYEVKEGDARSAVAACSDIAGKVDAVITSPPYATALPYLDTDRLSLIYLGLLPREQHRARDSRMIGNREISPREREAIWAYYERNRLDLPEPTSDMIEKIDSLNREGSVGFRRMNLAALLSKYFFDMRDVVQQMHELLRIGGTMFLVVGSNHTKAGTEPVVIDTPDHLAMIASEIGFEQSDDVAMEMLVPRSIFRKNAVKSERILKFEKTQ